MSLEISGCLTSHLSNNTFFTNNDSKNRLKNFTEKFLKILSCVFEDHAPMKKWSKKRKSFIGKTWIDDYLRYLMGVGDTRFMRYCRAKTTTEKLKICFR